MFSVLAVSGLTVNSRSISQYSG